MSRMPEVGVRVGVKVHEWNALLVSKVEEVGAGVVVIALPSDGRSEYDLPKGITVDLEWASPRVLMRVRGSSGGQRAGDGVPTIAVELAADPQVFQRRDYVRANAAVQLVVRRAGFDNSLEGMTIDVSGGGVQASIPGCGVGVDDRLEIELLLPEESSIVADVRVIRRNGEVFSLVFETIEPKEQERLIRFVFARLRGAAGKAA